VLRRLVQATNAHDIDAIVACFGSGYRNDTPAHPSRSFVGREQVRRNWEQILGFVPDLHAEVLRLSAQDGVVWSEWEQRGTRRDGTPHLMRGVIIFGVEDDAIAWARFYLEPVQQGAETSTTPCERQVARAAGPGATPPEGR
jgi:SnoaL-like polyketide cyclase.